MSMLSTIYLFILQQRSLQMCNTNRTRIRLVVLCEKMFVSKH